MGNGLVAVAAGADPGLTGTGCFSSTDAPDVFDVASVVDDLSEDLSVLASLAAAVTLSLTCSVVLRRV